MKSVGTDGMQTFSLFYLAGKVKDKMSVGSNPKHSDASGNIPTGFKRP